VIAILCVIESLQILANLANLSASWAKSIPNVKGAITGLARVMLRLYDLETSDSLSAGSGMYTEDPIATAMTDQPKTAVSIVKSEELLCLVLAIFTNLMSMDRSAAETIASISMYASLSKQDT